MFRFPWLILPAILLSCWNYSVTNAQEAEKSTAPPPNNADLIAIRKQSDAFVAAFNKKDAAALSKLWSPEGELIDASGERFVGREAIKKSYEDLFSKLSAPEIALPSIRCA